MQSKDRRKVKQKKATAPPVLKKPYLLPVCKLGPIMELRQQKHFSNQGANSLRYQPIFAVNGGNNPIPLVKNITDKELLKIIKE
jgi:hypothetical protein